MLFCFKIVLMSFLVVRAAFLISSCASEFLQVSPNCFKIIHVETYLVRKWTYAIFVLMCKDVRLLTGTDMHTSDKTQELEMEIPRNI
jgi:hypothetical protein